MDVFGVEWARAWMAEINRDPLWRDTGRGWDDSVVLRLWPESGSPGRSLYVELANGECRVARVASDTDLETASYVIGAPRDTWQAVLAGGVDPILGLMQGKLRLERGNLLKLVPWARAAKVLLAAATRVPEGDWGIRGGDVGIRGGEGGTQGGDRGIRGDVRKVERTAEEAPAMGEAEAGFGAAPGRRSAFRRLDNTLFPMRLWQKAKKLGIWDPRDIGLNTDREDWSRLTEVQRDLLLRLAVQFRGGETAVTTELLPMLGVIAEEGRLEEEVYLTSFLWEEAKHVEMFDRFLTEVAPSRTELEVYGTPAWRRIFEDELPADLRALRHDNTPVAQVRAAVTYHLVVEGILAETGYHGYHLILERHGILPGMQRAIQYIKRDESRHVAWGLYLIGRLVAEHGDVIWKTAEARLAELLEPSLDVVREVFDAYEKMPFELNRDALLNYAMTAFRNRLSKLESTRHAPLHELLHANAD